MTSGENSAGEAVAGYVRVWVTGLSDLGSRLHRHRSKDPTEWGGVCVESFQLTFLLPCGNAGEPPSFDGVGDCQHYD